MNPQVGRRQQHRSHKLEDQLEAVSWRARREQIEVSGNPPPFARVERRKPAQTRNIYSLLRIGASLLLYAMDQRMSAKKS